MDKKPIVICVDDEPGLLDVLEGQLATENYDLRTFPSGVDLLADSDSLEACDIILLDVMMPGLDGFETTRRIRAEHPGFLPILLVTALGATEHKVMGLDAGATDFITKPTVGAELRARVRAHLRAKQMHEELQQLVIMKDNLTKMIVHDIRNPLFSISLALEAMGDPPDPSIIDSETWSLMRSQIGTGFEMCEQLLDITKIESNTLEVVLKPASVREMANGAAASLKLQGSVRNIGIKVDVPDIEIATDHKLVKRILINLIDNAVKYSPEGQSVTVSGKTTGTGFAFTVSDNGPGIPEEHHEKVFRLFGSAESRRGVRGAGIGLTFCKSATEAMNGSISIVSPPGNGCRFTVNLPN